MNNQVLSEVKQWPGPGRLLHVSGSASSGAPVLVTHGTFSNAGTCVAAALAFGADRPAYVLEWRARDVGWARPARFDYTDIALGEVAGAVAFLHRKHKGQVHFVGHSGGGLAMLLAMALAPEVSTQLASVSILAAQGTWRHPDLRNRLSVNMMEHLGRWIGYWPKRFLPIGPCSEAGHLKSNWVNWTKAGRIFDRDGRDVLAMLKGQTVPSLVLAGAADHDIAPPDACRPIAEALGARFEICGLNTGHAEDFTHPRLFKSRAAAQSIYPLIADWIAAH